MSGNIYLFSGKIGSGKTTLLEKWAETQPNIGGVLSVKIDGKRHFKNLENGEIRLMETKNIGLDIGKFNFGEEVFKWAENEIYKHFNFNKKYIIIDEIGPLEIRKEKGFHHLLLKIFRKFPNENPDLIIVVRDFLVSEFLEKYHLKNVKILPKNFFKKQNLSPIYGLIIGGGASKRMKSDKALLKINDTEQWKILQKILNPFCKETLISINNEQWETWAKNEDGIFVKDLEKYQNNGPLTGLLSAAETKENFGFFLVGIDYPLVKMEHFIQLYNARNADYEATCFEKDGFTEPLISIIEAKAIPKLKIFFEEGGNSINTFLKLIKTKKIKPENTDFLKNINTPEDFANFMEKNFPDDQHD